MQLFDRNNPNHQKVVKNAIEAAHQFGASFIDNAKEQCEANYIIPFTNRGQRNQFEQAVFDWSLELILIE